MSFLKIKKVDDINTNYFSNLNNIIKLLSSPLRTLGWLLQDLIFENIFKTSNTKVLLVGEGANEIYLI